MKIIIAPGGFKESLTAIKAASWIEKGVKKAIPEAHTIRLPMADGGGATVQTLVHATGGTLHRKKVTRPLGKPVTATYGMLGDGVTGVIEMSAASGLRLVPPSQRNPLRTTTYGTGQLVKAALSRGARTLIIGIGDSATVDGGAGMAQALGFRLLDNKGKEIGYGGGSLHTLDRIDTTCRNMSIEHAEIIVASDVDNPLTGRYGAARVYGQQKGATPAMVTRLDANLKHLARIVKRDLGVNIERIPGSGAAGGLGGGLIAFLNARLRMGIDIVADACGLRKHLRGAELVITGEGRLDGQTSRGKAPIGVARIAGEAGVPVIAISGSLGKNASRLNKSGINAVFSILTRPVSLDEAIAETGPALAAATEQLMRLYLLGK